MSFQRMNSGRIIFQIVIKESNRLLIFLLSQFLLCCLISVIIQFGLRNIYKINILYPGSKFISTPGFPINDSCILHSLHRIIRSEEHTSELQSRENLVCRLLLEKKKKI